MTGRARIGVAAAVALLLTSSGLLRLLHSGSWVWPIILAVIVSTAAGELFRRLIRSRPLVVAAQTLVVFWYDMVLLAHDEAFAGVLPTWSVFHRLGGLYSDGAHDIRNTFVGGDATPGIAAILVLSLSALAVLVDALAATYAAAPLAGLPLLALYLVPATRSGGGYDWLAFALAAGGYTALLSAEGRDRLGRWGRPLVHAGARRTGAGGKPDPAARAKVDTGPIAATGHQIMTFALIAAVIAPILLPTVSGGMFGIGPNSGDGPGSGGGGKKHFSLKVDLHANLNSDSDDVILSYTASKPVYLRFQTADLFSPTAKDGAFVPDPKAVIHPFGDGGLISKTVPGYPLDASQPKTIKVDITYLSENGTQDPDSKTPDNPLPVPYPAQRIPNPTLNGFGVDTDNLAVLGPGRVYKGMKYTALVYDTSPDQLSAAALNSATLPTDEDIDKFNLHNDLTPEGIPKSVSELAKLITKGKTNPVDQANLIQDYFHKKENGYSYTVKTPPNLTGAASMQWLIDNKKGFCQYYAATMVAMARSLGIPARVALGFTPGKQPKGTGTYEVRMHDYHAWPELFFHGVGWLRFEPTVSIDDGRISGGNGQVPHYNTVPTTASSTAPSPSQSTSTAPNAAASSGNDCPVEVRKAGDCTDNSQNTTAAPKSKFSWLGWFGAIPRFLQYWLFGGSGYAIALRVITLVLVLLACVPMAMRIARRRARAKLASGRRSDKPKKVGKSDAEDDEALPWQSADLPPPGRPEADPERLRILAAWAEVRDSATDLGYAWPVSETPRQSAARIVKQAHLSHDAQAAMDRVTGLAERANYARTLRRGAASGNPTSNPSGAAPTPDLLTDVKAIRAGLAEPVSRRARVRATVLPPSALAALRERREDLTGRVYERIQGTGTRLRSRTRPSK